MTHLKHEKYITLAIVIGFTSQLLLMPFALFLFPPDYSGEMPMYAPESNIMIEFGLAMFIFGATVMAIKLADEKKVLASAGFAMQAISAGVVMSSIFELMNPENMEAWEKTYYITTSSNFLYLPAMILISACDEFKKWVRLLGIFSAIPYNLSSFLFLFHYRNFTNLEYIGFIGYILMLFVQLMWAINVYNNYRKKMSASNN